MALKDAATKKQQNKRNRPDVELVRAHIEKELTTRLNAEIPVSLHKQLKVHVAGEGISITDAVIKAVREYLSKHSSE